MLASKLLHFVSLTDSFIMFDAKLLNSILNVNNSFTDPLIIGAFEKRAHGFESLSGHLLDLFAVVPSFLATERIDPVSLCRSTGHHFYARITAEFFTDLGPVSRKSR